MNDKFVKISDRALLIFINQALRKGNRPHPVTKEEIEKIEEMRLEIRYIEDVTDIKLLTNLKSLNISSGFLTKDRISAISQIPKLKSLDIDGCIISLDSLKELKDLEILIIKNTRVKDMSFLKGFKKLGTLNIISAELSDLAQLNNIDLPNLAILNLSDNNIEDITPLSNFTNLVMLTISKNKIKDVSPLSEMARLNVLDINENCIEDITPLRNLVNLRMLSANKNNIKDISTLGHRLELSTLRINSNNISDIYPLRNLHELNILDLKNNNIGDISSIKHLKKLNFLTLSENKIADISYITKLKSLKKFDLSNQKIIVNDTDINGTNTFTEHTHSLEDVIIRGDKYIYPFNKVIDVHGCKGEYSGEITINNGANG